MRLKQPVLNELAALRKRDHDIMRRAELVIDFGVIGRPESQVRYATIWGDETADEGLKWQATPFQRAVFQRGSNDSEFRKVDNWIRSSFG